MLRIDFIEKTAMIKIKFFVMLLTRGVVIMCYGILIALGVWLSGFLLSGTFAYVELFELYYTGKLVLAFPFVFAVVSVIVAIFSKKLNNRSLYKSFIVSFLFR